MDCNTSVDGMTTPGNLHRKKYSSFTARAVHNQQVLVDDKHAFVENSFRTQREKCVSHELDWTELTKPHKRLMI